MTMKKNDWQVLYHYDSRRPARSYSRLEVIENTPMGRTVYIGAKGYDWTAWLRRYKLSVVGERIFWKVIEVHSCTFKDGKFYGTLAPFTEQMCKLKHIDWILSNEWVKRILCDRKDLWKQVFLEKITNPRDLVRAFSRKNFKGIFSYPALKSYCECGTYNGISLWSIYHYTTNPVVALDKLTGWSDDGEYIKSLMYDMIRLAEIFNEKINPSWSLKRMRDEHERQIERRNLVRLEGISSKPLAPSFSSEGLSLILNERECYLEGCTMHNCVHSCYWRKISSGNYLIAKGIVCGLYVDVGIKSTRNTLMLDQVHSIYNENVSDEVVEFCKKWIATNESVLLSIMSSIKSQANEDALQDILPW